MGTSKETIRGWLQEAQRKGATHVIVVCDTFDHEDYPVSVMPNEDVHTVHAKHDGPNMQRVMEVYAMHLDLEAQLVEHRAFHFETGPVEQPTATRRRPVVAPPPTEPKCGTCGNHGLLSHEAWCEEGHVALTNEVVRLRQQEVGLRGFVLWLADCHAATAEYDGTLKGTSRARRERFASLCVDAAEAIDRLFTGDKKDRYAHEGRTATTGNAVIARLRQACQRITRSTY